MAMILILMFALLLTQMVLPGPSAQAKTAAGLYTTSLLAARDKTHLIVQLYSAEVAALDYGHAGLLWADNAGALVWKPIADWIAKH